LQFSSVKIFVFGAELTKTVTVVLQDDDPQHCDDASFYNGDTTIADPYYSV